MLISTQHEVMGEFIRSRLLFVLTAQLGPKGRLMQSSLGGALAHLFLVFVAYQDSLISMIMPGAYAGAGHHRGGQSTTSLRSGRARQRNNTRYYGKATTSFRESNVASRLLAVARPVLFRVAQHCDWSGLDWTGLGNALTLNQLQVAATGSRKLPSWVFVVVVFLCFESRGEV